MGSVRETDVDGFRVIVCCTFNQRADNDEVEALKRRVLACRDVVHAIETSGAFDFMIEAELADLAAYNAKRKSYAKDLSRLVDRFEANFVCRRYIRSIHEFSDCIWIPGTSGLRRIQTRLIDKIVAEGDYVRIFSEGSDFLHHATMGSLLARLHPEQFLHIHRSMIVRCGFIMRLTHQPQRWIAELADGTQQKISKSKVASVLHCLRGDSSNTTVNSSVKSSANEKQRQSAEELVQLS